MKEYVLIVVFKQRRQRVLLQLKDRGTFSGKLNCPGGKIERGEPPISAARRELLEEVGIARTHLTPIILQEFANNTRLYVYATELAVRELIVQTESEQLEWFLTSHVASMLDPSLAEGVPYYVHLAKNILEAAWQNSK